MRVTFSLLLLLLSAACAPYKMDVRQGNYVTPEMVAKLKPGMSRIQVKSLLGTPLIADPYHPERWDYPYTLEHRHDVVESQRLTLYFEGETLKRIDDSGMPKAAAPGAGAKP